jgi:hypothetical protein
MSLVTKKQLAVFALLLFALSIVVLIYYFNKIRISKTSRADETSLILINEEKKQFNKREAKSTNSKIKYTQTVLKCWFAVSKSWFKFEYIDLLNWQYNSKIEELLKRNTKMIAKLNTCAMPKSQFRCEKLEFCHKEYMIEKSLSDQHDLTKLFLNYYFSVMFSLIDCVNGKSSALCPDPCTLHDKCANLTGGNNQCFSYSIKTIKLHRPLMPHKYINYFSWKLLYVDYECTCDYNYYMDPKLGQCVPVYDACEHLKPCRRDATCVSIADISKKEQYKCVCDEKHGGEACNQLKNDPCGDDSPGRTRCGNFSCQIDPTDFRLSYSCACDEKGLGYARHSQTDPSCVDVNECALNRQMCYNGATCINTLGSFECLCALGYEGSRCEARSIASRSVVGEWTPWIEVEHCSAECSDESSSFRLLQRQCTKRDACRGSYTHFAQCEEKKWCAKESHSELIGLHSRLGSVSGELDKLSSAYTIMRSSYKKFYNLESFEQNDVNTLLDTENITWLPPIDYTIEMIEANSGASHFRRVFLFSLIDIMKIQMISFLFLFLCFCAIY